MDFIGAPPEKSRVADDVDKAVLVCRVMGKAHEFQIDHAQDHIGRRDRSTERNRPAGSNGGKGRISGAVGLTSLFKDRSRSIEKSGTHATPPWVSNAQ